MSRKRAVPDDDSIYISSDESDASEEEEEYHVEVITRAKVTDSGKLEYLVKWYGYSSDDDTWEPEANVLNCETLLKKFWKNIPGGKELKHNPGLPGTNYEADETWIDRERKFFRESMDKEKEKAKHKKEEKERQRKEALARNKHKPQKSIKLVAKTDAPSRERQAGPQDVRSLFANEMESDKQTTNVKAKTNEENKTKSVANIPSDSCEMPVATSSKVKIQPKPMMPPLIQTAAVQRSKLAGLKIPKKSAISAQATPVAASPSERMNVDNSEQSMPLSAASPTVPGRPNPVRRPSQSTPTLRQITTTTTPVFTSTKPSPVAPSPVASAGVEDVDNFMATIMSFNDSISQRPDNLSQSPVTAVSPSAEAISIDKNWKWNGNLYLDTADATQRLCDIAISESYSVADPGFKLSIILDAKDSVRFSKVYNRFEANSIVNALKKVDQIARISHSEEKDRASFTALVNYLKAGDLVIAAPVITDYGHVAQMIVFPAPATKQTSNTYPKSLSQHLFLSLNVPSHYLGGISLIVVLMPWTVKPSQYTELSLTPDELRQTALDEELKKMRLSPPSFTFKITPQVERAIRILGFPEWFLSFMAPLPPPIPPPVRTYCVWAYPVEPMPRDSGRDFSTAARRETRSLLFLLRHIGALNVGYKADVRIIFVHVGALRTINKLPALGDRRCKRPEIQFILYGSHESIKPIYWGFDQIFPLGGVVTLSFTALLENPVAVADLIEKVSSHKLWSCYILPSVLSVFIGIACASDDPVATYKQEPWRLGRILTLIDEGKLALMQSPPIAEQSPPGDNANPREEWIAAQYACAGKSSVDIVADAWASFKANNMGKSEEILKRASEVDIVKDLINLQMQPYIRKTYRRFVVLKAMQDTNIPFDRDGFEWRTVQDFDFRDHYNAKPSVEPSPN